jgi:tetratricopeptide (TPR) repeat protein
MTSLFVVNTGNGPEAGRALYIRGLSHARSGKRARAYTDLRAAAAQSDDAQVVWRSEFALGELSFEDGDWAAAKRRYSAAVGAMRPIPPMDRGLYRLAVSAQRLGEWEQGRGHFELLVRRFPRSPLAGSARRILHYAPRYFTLQCGAFAVSKNADALKRQLAREDISAVVRREVRGGRRLYIVYAGRYSTYADAQRGLTEIRRQVPDAVIWP